MKRVLLIAPYFLPRRRVGSMRPFRFAIHLKEFGWEPTVLTIAAPGQQLSDKEARLLSGIDIVQLKPPFDRTIKAESQLGIAAKRSSSVTRKQQNKVLDYIEQQFPIDTWLPLFWMKYQQMVKTVQRVQPDVIWSTADPWSSLVITERLVRRFGIPWVADFRDPWTLCKVRNEGKWEISKAIDRYCERRVLERTDVALFVAQQTEALYRKHFTELNLHTATITNSFDRLIYDDAVDLMDYATSYPTTYPNSSMSKIWRLSIRWALMSRFRQG